ncbi:alaserpin-like isoform X2 [Maniola hyperantus]|uniref:alaserpin-like isoform X2 n=1 Tax=Aphantopus hyperantus TaxID=2795564 RepID=UPI0015696665|nr:alaserpin-like isoform X1 [Maniola hyperantus]XP_034824392.1 alaserpin-like isoform X1 [Maniola hyperantus]
MKPLFLICFLSLAIMAAADQKRTENLLHDGNNKFTANMFSEVAKTNLVKSFVISGFSVLTPLAQLGLASVGEPHDELLNAIGMPDDNSTKEVFSWANTRVRGVKGVTLKTASKIYVAKNYELNPEFAAVTKDTFGSELQNIDFVQKQSAANEVNAWVEEQTNNRIKDLVDPDNLDQDTRALLVNAIYFKGSWAAQFDKSLTREKDFFVTLKHTTKVDMMYRKGDYRYTDSAALKSQVIEIPYQGGETSLVIVLPHEIEGITEVEEILKDLSVLDKTLSEMYETEVDLYLPKFKIETTTDLKDVLEKMNVKKVFSEVESRLDNLLSVKQNLYVSSATQKAFIEVNEEGAEAAAANVFITSSRSVSSRLQRIKFRADRPFIFYLYEGENILFSGVFNS